MPTPYSISSDFNSNPGLPTSGLVAADSATPIVLIFLTTSLAKVSISSKVAPWSAAAPKILCTKTVPATPRRPWVYRLSFTAISSSTTTDLTSIPSASAKSLAISKFITSPE